MLFHETDTLKSDEIYLKLMETKDADPEKDFVPSYRFDICLTDNGEVAGHCDLRIGHNQKLYYGGNIGYGVNERYRGNHYAAKACLLLFELAKRHDMGYLYITCNPENRASARTCELAGGVLECLADLPPDNDMYLRGETKKLIYRFDLTDTSAK